MKLVPWILLTAALATSPALADEVSELRQALQEERARAASDRARAQRELSELRARLAEREDALLEQARRVDQDLHRLQGELERARHELSARERDAALERARLTAQTTLLQAQVSELRQRLDRPEDENDLLELRVSLVFKEASLEEVLSYLEEISGLTFHIHEGRLEQIQDAKLSLRLHELPLRVALELALLNATLGDERLGLTWRREDDGIYLQ